MNELHRGGEYVSRNRYPIYTATEAKVHGIENEDAYLKTSGLGLVGVFDGVGGSPKGNVASAFTADVMQGTLQGLPMYSATSDKVKAAMRGAWQEAAYQLYRYKKEHHLQGDLGTTAVVAKVINDGRTRTVVFAQSGDSRMYVIRRDGTAELLTRDEGQIDSDLKRGWLSIADAETISRILDSAETEEAITRSSKSLDVAYYWKGRNIINNRIGSDDIDDNTYAYIGKSPTFRTDYAIDEVHDRALLLITDGVNDPLSRRKFDEVLKRFDQTVPNNRNLRNLSKDLVAAARDASIDPRNFRRKSDDITAVVMGLDYKIA